MGIENPHKNIHEEIPEENLVSLEELSAEDSGENNYDAEDILPPELRQYFTNPVDWEEKGSMGYIIAKALEKLGEKNPRMADIIREVYLMGRNYRETAEIIAQKYGQGKITAERVRQIVGEGIKKLRSIISETPPKKPKEIKISQEQLERIEKIPNDYFLGYCTVRENKIISVVFSPEFRKLHDRTIVDYLKYYKNIKSPKIRDEIKMEIEKVTGFSPEDLLARREQLNFNYFGKIKAPFKVEVSYL
jgi:hypothetical protein